MLINSIFPLSFCFMAYAPEGGDGAAGPTDEEVREAGFKKLADRYNNDGLAIARELYAENYQLRRKNADLSSQLNSVRDKVPAEGAVTLSPEEAQRWAAYQAIGTPDQVKGWTEERGQLQGKLDALLREAVLREAANTAGFRFEVLKDADALATLNGKKLTYEVREVEQNGSKTKTAFVKDGDAEKPLAEFAQETWANLMPSLAVAQQDDGSRRSGAYFPPQHAGVGSGNQPKTTKQQAEATLNKKYASRAPTP